MSWDSYIDNLIAQTKDESGTAQADKGCIIGIDGGGNWTSTSGETMMSLRGSEGATIAGCFKGKDFTPFMASGIRIEGLKYQFLREEGGKVVYGKAKGNGAVTLQASKTAVVIAHCKEGCQHGNVNKGVAVISEYLESLGM